MSSLTLMDPTGSLGSVSPGADRRLPQGAVELHETIRRVEVPHKEQLSFLHIHSNTFVH